jgi:hypothetical protein
MYMLLLLAVILVFLLQPASAAGSIMDYTVPGTPLEPFLSSTDSFLDEICQCCAMPFYQCMQTVVSPYCPL